MASSIRMGIQSTVRKLTRPFFWTYYIYSFFYILRFLAPLQYLIDFAIIVFISDQFFVNLYHLRISMFEWSRYYCHCVKPKVFHKCVHIYVYIYISYYFKIVTGKCTEKIHLRNQGVNEVNIRIYLKQIVVNIRNWFDLAQDRVIREHLWMQRFISRFHEPLCYSRYTLI